MKLFLTIPNRINFLQMGGRFGRSSEQRFRMNCRKKFDWISFNRTLVHEGNPNRRAIAIAPSYISKSGKYRSNRYASILSLVCLARFMTNLFANGLPSLS